MNLIESLKPAAPTTLGRALIHGLVRALVATALIAATALVAQMGTLAHADTDTPTLQVERSQTDRLMDLKCQPYAKGTLPGHAVVTLPGHAATYVESGVGFDLWGPDKQYGTADDLPGTLHAFCR